MTPSTIYTVPRDLRLACRDASMRRATSGQVPGFLQANLMILPREQASDFLLFCKRNPKPCPIIEVLQAGSRAPRCADGADIATDAPGYRVYRHGELAEEKDDIQSLWRDDLVSFLLGCSFSFEAAVLQAGVPLRHVAQGRNVAMYRTNIACKSAGAFAGEMVVSMRPVRAADVAKVIEISSRMPLAHGEPVHAGAPSAIGIRDIGRPDYGDPVDMEPGDVPVFWACGVTPQWVAQKSRIPFCITHAPGKMLVTDLASH